MKEVLIEYMAWAKHAQRIYEEVYPKAKKILIPSNLPKCYNSLV